MKFRKLSTSLILLVAISSIVQCNTSKKYKLPRKNINFEVHKKAVKTELDLTPITNYYALSGTDLGVSS